MPASVSRHLLPGGFNDEALFMMLGCALSVGAVSLDLPHGRGDMLLELQLPNNVDPLSDHYTPQAIL